MTAMTAGSAACAAHDSVATERRSGEDRRDGVNAVNEIDPTTCERDYSDAEVFFMKAMDQYKRDNRRPFPTWSEVLEVLFAMGYRKVADPTPIPGSPEAHCRQEERRMILPFSAE